MISIAYVKIIYPSSGIYCIYMYIPELKKMSRPVVQAKKIFLCAEQVTFKAFLPGPGKSCSKK